MSDNVKTLRQFNIGETIAALDMLLFTLSDTEINPTAITRIRRIELVARIDAVKVELARLSDGISLIRLPETILDPSEPHVIGKLIADVLLEQPRHALENVPRFYGSGVYAIYYVGDFPAYAPSTKTETPLYVGKADPATPNASDPIQQGEKLSIRLADHSEALPPQSIST